MLTQAILSAVLLCGIVTLARTSLLPTTVRLGLSVRVPQAAAVELSQDSVLFKPLCVAANGLASAARQASPLEYSTINRLMHDWREGTTMALSLPDKRRRFATIQIVQTREDGWSRAGGLLSDGGSFSFGSDGASVRGLVQCPGQGVAWRLHATRGGVLEYTKLPLSAVRCSLPRAPDQHEDPLPSEDELRAPAPVLSSRPEAKAVLFLDFNGAIVTDPNYGSRTIRAPRARMSTRQISDVFDRVAGDFASFDVDVTTNPTRYANAPVGSRMRCIITSNDQAGPGTGGGSYVGSFAAAGTGELTEDIPCWVFHDRKVDVCAEAISHEFGHTLGLVHDGRDFPGGRHQEYYPGHGRGETGWAPIMGVSYHKKLSQWSKGEYKFASDPEDDIAVIAGPVNGFGLIADDVGDTIDAAVDLGHGGPIVTHRANIRNQEDVDVFRFVTLGGPSAIQVKSAGREANVDLLLELLDATGATILSSNPKSTLTAGFRTVLSAGTYYLRVRGTGKRDPLKDGYTAYGSIGSYRIVGKVLGLETAYLLPITAG